MNATAYIGLGSNLQQPVQQLAIALHHIRCIKNTSLTTVSSLYESLPVGVGIVDQPNFINQVISVNTSLSAVQLLRELLLIERIMGRVRKYRFGPRIIDCDLLLYENKMIETPDLIIPHPRMSERAFVLYPLTEIAPSLRLPTGELVQNLCVNCAAQSIMRLEVTP